MKRGLVFFLLCIFLASFVSAALGVSPAVKEFDFVPGKVITLKYFVSSDNPEQEIEVFTSAGELQEYVSINKEKITGPGSFTVTIRLPDNIETPGIHRISVGAREIPSEDEFIGTTIDIRGVIKIFVPFPGKYLETQLSIPDGNIDEKIPVELHVVNRGKESLNIAPVIEFLTEGTLVHTMEFTPVEVGVSGDRFFRKFLDTTDYAPGDYKARAVINYGEITTVEGDFRIGSLFVRIANFTESLVKGGIQEYDVYIESRWNNKLDEVFADVNISNQLQSMQFRTPSAGLEAWEKKTLTGFLDTESLEGKYDVEITLSYSDQQTTDSGTLTIREINYTLLIGAIVGAGLLVIIILVLIFVILRRKASKKKRK